MSQSSASDIKVASPPVENQAAAAGSNSASPAKDCAHVQSVNSSHAAAGDSEVLTSAVACASEIVHVVEVQTASDSAPAADQEGGLSAAVDAHPAAAVDAHPEATLAIYDFICGKKS